MSRRLVLFDLDGTLVDSQRMIHACMSDAFLARGLAPPPIEDVRRIVGLHLVEGIARLLPVPRQNDAEATADAYRAAFRRRRDDGAVDEVLFPGVREMVMTLADRGYVLGIATGKGLAGLDRVLETHGLAAFFPVRQSGDPPPGKPNPAMVFRALAETGIPAEAAVMVGDTSFDIEMAVSAGVRAIGVAWGYHKPTELLAAGAECIVEEAHQVVPLIDYHNKNDTNH